MARPNLAVLEARKKSFIQPVTDIDRILKLVGREQDVAVKAIMEVINNTKDEKLRVETSKFLLNFLLEVSKEKEHRELTRLIASFKYNDGSRTFTTDDDDVAVLDFDTIVESN